MCGDCAIVCIWLCDWQSRDFEILIHKIFQYEGEIVHRLTRAS